MSVSRSIDISWPIFIGNERTSACCSSTFTSRISNSLSRGVCHAQTFGVSDREAWDSRGSPRSRSRLEITPFHPYLRGERVSRKGAVASSIAWLHRDEYIPEVHVSAAKTDARIRRRLVNANNKCISGEKNAIFRNNIYSVGKNRKINIPLLFNWTNLQYESKKRNFIHWNLYK